MIAESIPRKLGAGRTTAADFRTLVDYVCAKASAVATCNMLGDWRAAAWQMWAIANGNRTHKTLTYHVCFTWQHLEQPSNDEMMDVARRGIVALELQEYQAVIGIHRDNMQGHVHVALNRVHPRTFKVFRASQDFGKLERFCRETEQIYGWPADRGRFHVDMTEGGIDLVPPTLAQQEAKQLRRERGRGAGQSDLNYERQTGRAPLITALSDGWKARIKTVLETAGSWHAVHAGLADLGLAYVRSRAGARLTLCGSEAFLAPSQLGVGLGLNAMMMRLGRSVDALEGVAAQVSADPTTLTNRLSRQTDGENAAQSRRLAYIVEAYVALTADRDTTARIVRVRLDGDMPCVTLDTGAVVQDIGDAIVTGPAADDRIQARIAVAMAAAKGWAGCVVSGSQSFVRAALAIARDMGMIPKSVAIGEDPVLLPQPPTPCRKDHLQADKARRSALQRRTAEAIERSELAARQKIDRDKLSALLAGAQGLGARAMRLGLRMYHEEQRQALRGRHQFKRILSPSVRATSVPLSAADRQSLRAQRLLAGMTPDGTGQGWAAGEDLDHTACRQIWDAAGLLSNDGENGAAIVQGPDRRMVEKGGQSLTLCAHRNAAGSIVAFESLYPDVAGEMTCSIAQGGHPTIFVLNDVTSASRVVVVERALEAIQLDWVERDRTDTAYVSIGEAFGPWTRRRLEEVCAGRQVIGAFGEPDTAALLMADLRKIIPTAQWSDRDPAVETACDDQETGPDIDETDGQEPGFSM